MYEPAIIAAAIVTVLGALVTGTVTVINAVAASRDRSDSKVERKVVKDIVSSTERKADNIVEKTIEIHSMTNSNLTKVTEALSVALEKISGLEKLILSMVEAKKTADEHSQRAAAAAVSNTPRSPSRVDDKKTVVVESDKTIVIDSNKAEKKLDSEIDKIDKTDKVNETDK